ncbi:AMIN-like domain-containing (lipo)protein [Lentzea cavernae]|uniref:AMIN-like domain-containing protein n=1 Tax=Lentzea cavernae TaxID=2020703 RepID=A0ABQ3MMU2_9PSEU|nr:hypothetical protein [Lentzea cavernae]GHH52029.1 hypothetical protein GCM10017774_63420 [Lentzea cavernae]
MKRIAAALAVVGTAVGVPVASAAEGNEHRTTGLAHCGSGEPVAAKGDEFLVVSILPASAHGHAGPRSFDTPWLGKVKSVTNTCDFEAHLDFAIGYSTAGRACTISFLDDPSRVVVDINNN